MPEACDPGEGGAAMDLGDATSCGDRLALDSMPAARNPKSGAHGETLFTVQRQASGPWMKLIPHELGAAREALKSGDLPAALKMLARAARVFGQTNGQRDVPRTMAPAGYAAFRGGPGPSSGFQSHQHRPIEFVPGNRDPNMAKPHARVPAARGMLADELARPSFHDEAIRHLFAELDGDDRGAPPPQLDSPREAAPEVQARWKTVCLDIDARRALYELAEKLADLEDYFRRRRFNHATTVERAIGFKRGTGGAAAVPCPRRMPDVALFPGPWNVRGEL